MSNSHNSSELDEILAVLYNAAWVEGSNWEQNNPEGSPIPSQKEITKTANAKAKLLALIAKHTQEAEQNAVAWCVMVLDEFHGMPHVGQSAQRDKFYKGVKNGLRDRFRSETGIDPAPTYPIRATLKANTDTLQGEPKDNRPERHKQMSDHWEDLDE